MFLLQSPKGARRPVAKYLVPYLYSLEDMTCLALPTAYQLEVPNFPYPLSFSALVPADPF